MDKTYDLIVVGGGIAGVATAYYGAQRGLEVLLIEAGEIGKGTYDMPSGTAGLLNGGTYNHSKMVAIRPESGLGEFIQRHGEEEAKHYLKAAAEGRKQLRNIVNSVNRGLKKEYGSLLINEFDDMDADGLKSELDSYQRIGFRQEVEWFNRTSIEKYVMKNLPFEEGVYFERDYLVDPGKLLEGMIDDERIETMKNISVREIHEDGDTVTVRTDDNKIYRARKAVIATNGFRRDEHLEQMIDEGNWSFIVGWKVRHNNMNNVFTLAESDHYAGIQGGIAFVGGEDLTIPRDTRSFRATEEIQQRQFRKLQDYAKILWQDAKFKKALEEKPEYTHHGVFFYTKDRLPIVGPKEEKSNISYLVGCNGWAWSTIIYNAQNVLKQLYNPETMNKQEKVTAELFSPRRASLAAASAR